MQKMLCKIKRNVAAIKSYIPKHLTHTHITVNTTPKSAYQVFAAERYRAMTAHFTGIICCGCLLRLLFVCGCLLFVCYLFCLS
jgi:hypothetical protein